MGQRQGKQAAKAPCTRLHRAAGNAIRAAAQNEKRVGTTDPTPPLRGGEGAIFFHLKSKKNLAFRYANPRASPPKT